MDLNLNAHDAVGLTPLHRAVLTGNHVWVRIFLALGADPNVRDASETGHTPLSLAAKLAPPRVIEAMAADWRCDWDKADGHGFTAAQRLLLRRAGSYE